MSDTDAEFETSSGMKQPRFHGNRGEDYGLWRHRLRAACRVKGVWGVVDTTQTSSTTTPPLRILDRIKPMTPQGQWPNVKRLQGSSYLHMVMRLCVLLWTLTMTLLVCCRFWTVFMDQTEPFLGLLFKLSFSGCRITDKICHPTLISIRRCSRNWSEWAKIWLFRTSTKLRCCLRS